MPEYENTIDLYGGESATLDALISRESTFTSFRDDRVTTLRSYAFRAARLIQIIDLPLARGIGNSAFVECSSLESVHLGSAKTLPLSIFDGLYNLQYFSLPSLTVLPSNAFRSCTALSSVVLPISTSIIYNGAFGRCTNLERVDAPGVNLIYSAFYSCNKLAYVNFPEVSILSDNAFAGAGFQYSATINLPKVSQVHTYAFQSVKAPVIQLPSAKYLSQHIVGGSGPEGFDFTALSQISNGRLSGNANMIHLVLRSNSVCNLLSNISYTPIAEGIGHIYVPDSLVEEYKSATNWANYADRFLSLGAYPTEPSTTITDTWQEIFDAELDGTYRSKYHIGDTKTIRIDGYHYLVKIIAIDTDVLASDTSKTAPITWITKGVFSAATWYNGVTTTNTSWDTCSIREYLRNTVFPGIEEPVRSNIKPVVKTFATYNTTNSIEDTLWLLSRLEISNVLPPYSSSVNIESSGVVYTDAFPEASYLRRNSNAFAISIVTGVGSYFLRTVGGGSTYNGTHPMFISCTSTGGDLYTSMTDTKYYIAFGFCT